MTDNVQESWDGWASARMVEAMLRDGVTPQKLFAWLHDALETTVGFKVLTVLKLDAPKLRSMRVYSSEATYPIGGTKQHVSGAWSETVLGHRKAFVARDVAMLRATFPDSAAIEATGCGSIIAAPTIDRGLVVGTMNLWHREGYYDEVKTRLAQPFATAIGPLLRTYN